MAYAINEPKEVSTMPSPKKCRKGVPDAADKGICILWAEPAVIRQWSLSRVNRDIRCWRVLRMSVLRCMWAIRWLTDGMILFFRHTAGKRGTGFRVFHYQDGIGYQNENMEFMEDMDEIFAEKRWSQTILLMIWIREIIWPYVKHLYTGN